MPLPRILRERVEAVPRVTERRLSEEQKNILVPIRIENRGTQPATGTGPARWHIVVDLIDSVGEVLSRTETPLPQLVMPGRSVPAALVVPAPRLPGQYRMVLRVVPVDGKVVAPFPYDVVEATVAVSVGRTGMPATVSQTVQDLLADAHRLHRLPDDYQDVTTGWFARAKRWLKRKILNNFKIAYVDVLSRRQSAFNDRVLAVLTELAERCAALEQAWEQQTRTPPGQSPATNNPTPAKRTVV
ncbi:MAG: hypothetical protein KatS3mg105_4286 [Gemmatales bacterium]|nr:MAG: hypothetical protein KatS3mg105_4286 [Gemmatales bacterium]